jgi:hypothetical protein
MLIHATSAVHSVLPVLPLSCCREDNVARYAFAADRYATSETSKQSIPDQLAIHQATEAMYRLLYENVIAWEWDNAERSIADRLLHQFVKYSVPSAARAWQEFASHYQLQHCPDLTVKRVVEEILPLDNSEAVRRCIKRRVIVINFDEVAGIRSEDKSVFDSIYGCCDVVRLRGELCAVLSGE